ncbi:MAG: hypothetical protein WCA64_03970 [Gallionella sp.]
MVSAEADDLAEPCFAGALDFAAGAGSFFAGLDVVAVTFFAPAGLVFFGSDTAVAAFFVAAFFATGVAAAFVAPDFAADDLLEAGFFVCTTILSPHQV